MSFTGRRDFIDFHVPRGGAPAWSDEPATVRTQLEQLDDAMFAAIDGCEDSLSRAAELWQQAACTLDWRLLEESREQYLRYAVDVTRRFEFEDRAGPERSLLALEVIALLTKV